MNFNSAGGASYMATTVFPAIIGAMSQPDWNMSQGQNIAEGLKGNFKIESVYQAMQLHFKDYFRLNRFFVKLDFGDAESGEMSKINYYYQGVLNFLSYFISEATIPPFKNEVKILKRMGHVYKKPVRTFYDDEATIKIYLDVNGYVENILKLMMFETGTQFYNTIKFDITIYKNNNYWSPKSNSPIKDSAGDLTVNVRGEESEYGFSKFIGNTLTGLNPFGDTLGDRKENKDYLERKVPVDKFSNNSDPTEKFLIPIVKFKKVFIVTHDNPVLSYSNENQLAETTIHFGYESLEFEEKIFGKIEENNEFNI